MHTKSVLLIVIIGLSIGAGAFLLFAPDSTDPMFEEAKSAVRKKLRDPQSAIFTEIHSVDRPKGESGGYVCGLVNAKNELGGYAGPQRFSYALSNGRAFIEGGRAISMDIIDTLNLGFSDNCK